MPSHTRGRRSGLPRRLLRAALTTAATGAALVAGDAATACAAAPVPLGGQPHGPALTNQDVPAALGVLSRLQVNPLAKTGVDPLSNSAGTQFADFKPVSTAAVTGPLARGDSLSQLPVVGQVAKLVPGGAKR